LAELGGLRREVRGLFFDQHFGGHCDLFSKGAISPEFRQIPHVARSVKPKP
jgi:hypothetical protein